MSCRNNWVTLSEVYYFVFVDIRRYLSSVFFAWLALSFDPAQVSCKPVITKVVFRLGLWKCLYACINMYGVVCLAQHAAPCGTFSDIYSSSWSMCCPWCKVFYQQFSGADLPGITFIVLLMCLSNCSRFQDLRKSFTGVLNKWIYCICLKCCD